MNIAFFASSLVSAYWNGAATYYRGILRALHKRGHRITFYESDAFERQKHRDIADPDYARVVVYSSTGTDDVRRCLDQAASADLIVKASGNGVFDELLEAAVVGLKNARNLVAFWDVDAPATLDRVHNNPADPFLALIPRYDLILTYGGGEPVISAYQKLNARQCVPIYNALDPSTHHPVAPEPRFQADLGFLGNRLPDREARVEEFFLRAASLLPDRRFLLGGSGWHDKRVPPNVNPIGHVYTTEHNAFNCTPLAVLNVNRESMARYGFSPATRVFEAAGAGACLITDHFVGVDSFFEPEREILVARDGAEVARQLGDLTPDRARRIGQNALRHVLSHHTYDHRAGLLEEVLAASRPPASTSTVAAPASVPAQPVSPLRIVMIGLTITSSWGNGHATTYRGLVRELVRRGHEVLFLEHDKPWYASNRDLPHPPHGRTELYASVAELKQRFGPEVRAADAVIVGSFVPEGIEVGEWVTATAVGLTAFYDIDTPVTVAALERGECFYLAPALVRHYDLYLSFTGGPILRRLEREFGSPRAVPLYCSVDPDLYYPEPQPQRWTLGYLGTYSADRQPPLENLLLDPARRLGEHAFVVAGPQYPDSVQWPSNVERIAHLPPHEHRAFYNQQAFTLNITRADMIRAGYSPSVRLFEAAACGVPILSDRWAGIETILTPGSEILIVDTPGDVEALIATTDEETRRRIGQRARQRILAQHTAAHRAAQLEKYIATHAPTVPALSVPATKALTTTAGGDYVTSH